jgi:hypothetical protein
MLVMTLPWPRHCAIRELSLAIAGACRHWARARQADSADACARPIMLDEERERRRPEKGQRVIAHRVR